MPAYRKKDRTIYQFFHIIIYLAIVSLIWLACNFLVLARINDTLYDLEDKHNKFRSDASIEHPAKHIKGVPSTEFPTSNQINNNQEDNFRFKGNTLVDVRLQNNSNNEYNYNLATHGDTISQDDIVRNQYSLLPYPAVRKDRFFHEQKYYTHEQSQNNRPYSISHALVLEHLNHFLFKGRNDFM